MRAAAGALRSVFVGMKNRIVGIVATPAELPYANIIKDLHCQSAVTARIERKGIFRALSNRAAVTVLGNAIAKLAR